MAVGSCTDALAFALAAAGVGPGDEVLVTSFSFVATASPILRVGAMPVFTDIGADFNMDLDNAADLVTERTRAVIHAHLFGHMGDPDRLEGFANKHGLILIEDAAQAFGATRRGRAAGSLGLASCLSFDPTKVLGAPGSGGAVLTDDDTFADRVRRQRYHGKDPDGRFVDLGYNSQMPSHHRRLSHGQAPSQRGTAATPCPHRRGLCQGLGGIVGLAPLHPRRR